MCLSDVYPQIAEDYGGQRKEFLLLMLRPIKEKYFVDNRLIEELAEDYYTCDLLFGITLIL